MAYELTFYTNPQSRGRIARWMLEEAGAPYRTEIVHYGEEMQSGDYADINPMKKVPAIVHDGVVVTETAAICAYLADAFPEAGLAPAQDKRGPYYRWLFFAAGPLEQAITARMLGVEPTEDQQRMVGYGTMQRVLDVIEKQLEDNDYICGDRFNAADVYMGSHLAFGLQFETIEKRSAFERYAARLQKRDAWRKANEIDDAAAKEIEGG